VSDDIRTLTARLAEEPSSLAFLELGEMLRRRGQLDAAGKIVRGGLIRYPGLADAHDLLGRILSDQGDLAGAFDAWSDALRFDPMRIGALKGLAFLYYRAGDVAAALSHLERAAEADPDDPTIRQALTRVYGGAAPAEPAPAKPPPSPAPPSSNGAAPAPAFSTLESGDDGLLLIDGNGLRLTGKLGGPGGDAAGDRAAAQLAGVSREAARATRLLGLGAWQSVVLELPEAQLVLSAPTPETVLLTVCDRSLPIARVGLVADRASRAARDWLERLG
jgi:tetratricopeptide (TPR) repeat protein